MAQAARSSTFGGTTRALFLAETAIQDQKDVTHDLAQLGLYLPPLERLVPLASPDRSTAPAVLLRRRRRRVPRNG